MHAIGILCLVCLALLSWVVLLKLELGALQEEVRKLRDPTPREDRPSQVLTKQSGLKSFTISDT